MTLSETTKTLGEETAEGFQEFQICDPLLQKDHERRKFSQEFSE